MSGKAPSFTSDQMLRYPGLEAVSTMETPPRFRSADKTEGGEAVGPSAWVWISGSTGSLAPSGITVSATSKTTAAQQTAGAHLGNANRTLPCFFSLTARSMRALRNGVASRPPMALSVISGRSRSIASTSMCLFCFIVPRLLSTALLQAFCGRGTAARKWFPQAAPSCPRFRRSRNPGNNAGE